MDQAYTMVEEAANVLSDWRLKRAAQEKAAESKQSDENVEIRRQQRLLEYERQEFLRNKKFEEKRLEREKHIFDMEWKMLEDGWRKLAAEREQLERVYSKNGDDDERISFSNVPASIFFSGVNNMRSLRKRYKDLIKIFHPDNAEGDTDVIQKINEEYEVLRKRIGMEK
ncbi:MAG: hypothetical protein HFI81_04265 [Eubacterium sp.]|jgi:hypothetical protein|nr:hypothetical protein [Eubacterium sp.]